jgi:hypothetical protein
MYWLALFLIIVPLNLFAGFSVCGVTDPASVSGVATPASVGGVESDYSAACSSSTDGVLVGNVFEATAANTTVKWACTKMTTTATWDITGVIVGICDAGTDAGNVTAGIYPHDSTYDEPDADGTPIATKTVAASTITDCGDNSTEHEILFDALVTDIGATTVWVCTSESSSYMSRGQDNVGTRICYSDTAAPANNANWTCYNTYTYHDSILGCE